MNFLGACDPILISPSSVHSPLSLIRSTELVLISPDAGLVKIKKSDIEKRDRGLSGMPDGMGEILTKRDLRNLVEFLANQIASPERP